MVHADTSQCKRGVGMQARHRWIQQQFGALGVLGQFDLRRGGAAVAGVALRGLSVSAPPTCAAHRGDFGME